MEEAKVLWAQGEQQMGVSLLQYLAEQPGAQGGDKAYILALTGKWLSLTRSTRYRPNRKMHRVRGGGWGAHRGGGVQC